MGTSDQIKDKAQELIGKGKEAIGSAFGNIRMEEEGRAERAAAQARQARARQAREEEEEYPDE